MQRSCRLWWSRRGISRETSSGRRSAVDSIVELRRARERGAAVDVIDPAGRHALALDEAVKAQTFQVDREGFYEVHLADGRQQLVAVHADRAESDLATVPADLLSLWTHSGGNARALHHRRTRIISPCGGMSSFSPCLSRSPRHLWPADTRSRKRNRFNRL